MSMCVKYNMAQELEMALLNMCNLNFSSLDVQFASNIFSFIDSGLNNKIYN